MEFGKVRTSSDHVRRKPPEFIGAPECGYQVIGDDASLGEVRLPQNATKKRVFADSIFSK
jgi:hypothetical protein